MEEPDEAAWRAQQEWIREMSPPTGCDYVMGAIVLVVTLPLRVATAPVRWLLRRRER